MTKYQISKLYANGFGIWHCEIFSHGGDMNYETARRKARKAILEEIIIREESPTITPKGIAQGLKIEWVKNYTDNYSFPKPHTILFREKSN